jgi:signal transduction histidine kinase
LMLEISHELQTPLTVIRTEIDVLMEEMPENRNLKIFEKSINKLSGFIYDLLKLARLENEKWNENLEQINISEMLEELVEYFQVVVSDKGIELTSEIKKGVLVVGKKNRLEEVITNLVSNASRYMDEKQRKKIMIKLISSDGWAKILVSDTGMGIKKENIKHLFKRFYRVKESKGVRHKGTGLGLAICKSIINKHDGKIDVKSSLGKGTTFTVYLPLSK